MLARHQVWHLCGSRENPTVLLIPAYLPTFSSFASLGCLTRNQHHPSWSLFFRLFVFVFFVLSEDLLHTESCAKCFLSEPAVVMGGFYFLCVCFIFSSGAWFLLLPLGLLALGWLFMFSVLIYKKGNLLVTAMSSPHCTGVKPHRTGAF